MHHYADRISKRGIENLVPANATLAAPSTKWRVVSALQKAIRRGDVNQAHLTASALMNSGETDYLYRRLSVIAMEDIAFGDIPLVAEVYAFCGYSAVRKELPPATMLNLVKWMAMTPRRDRSPCELSTVANYAHSFELRMKILRADQAENLDIALHHPDQSLRLVAGWALCGDLHDQKKNRVERETAHRDTKRWHEFTAGMPSDHMLIAKKGLTYGGECAGLASAMRICWEMEGKPEVDLPFTMFVHEDNAPAYTYINGLMSVAFDEHNHEGKRAMAYFNKACPAVGAFFEANPVPERLRTLGNAIFESEGKWCKGRSWTAKSWDHDQLGMWLNGEARGLSGTAFGELRKIVIDNIDLLNHARKRVME